jgi:hypothetical protein
VINKNALRILIASVYCLSDDLSEDGSSDRGMSLGSTQAINPKYSNARELRRRIYLNEISYVFTTTFSTPVYLPSSLKSSLRSLITLSSYLDKSSLYSVSDTSVALIYAAA